MYMYAYIYIYVYIYIYIYILIYIYIYVCCRVVGFQGELLYWDLVTEPLGGARGAHKSPRGPTRAQGGPTRAPATFGFWRPEPI